MLLLKYLLVFLSIASFLFGLIVMLPEKLKLAKKYGPHTTNAHLIALARQGNSDVVAFYRKSKLFGVVFGCSVLGLVLINQFARA